MLRRCGLGPDALLLLGMGRYSSEKRWPMIVEAAHAAGTQQAIGLLLVREGGARRGLIARAAGSPHVVIGEAVRDRSAMARIMASADALVHGCEAETYCMAAAEARASGLPLIVPDRGGAADHATAPADRQYRADDAAALHDAMVSMAGAKRVGGAAIGRASLRTMDNHFSDLLDAYARTVPGRMMAA